VQPEEAPALRQPDLLPAPPHRAPDDSQSEEALDPVRLVTELHTNDPDEPRSEAMSEPIEHRDVTPAEQPYTDGMFISLCSCGQEFTGNDPDEADYNLAEHIHTVIRPCGCPSDVVTSTLNDGGEQCGRCGTTWDRYDRITSRQTAHLPSGPASTGRTAVKDTAPAVLPSNTSTGVKTLTKPSTVTGQLKLPLFEIPTPVAGGCHSANLTWSPEGKPDGTYTLRCEQCPAVLTAHSWIEWEAALAAHIAESNQRVTGGQS
jgi:hypothetical protein